MSFNATENGVDGVNITIKQITACKEEIIFNHKQEATRRYKVPLNIDVEYSSSEDGTLVNILKLQTLECIE